MNYSIGRTGFSLTVTMIRHKNQVRAELYISNANAKAFFYLLLKDRESVHAELGYQLEWEELPEGKDSRISVSLANANPEDQRDWLRQHEWLTAKLQELRRVFAYRVKALDANQWQAEVRSDGVAVSI